MDLACEEWPEAFRYMLQWFWRHWKEHTPPLSRQAILERRSYMERVVSDMLGSPRKAQQYHARKQLRPFVENDKRLGQLYAQIGALER